MVEITWTDLALKDFQEIEQYISQDSVVYAIKTIEKIFNRVSGLTKHPKSGRIVPEFENEKLRELIEGNYRIVYLFNDQEITIIRIHHSARMLK